MAVLRLGAASDAERAARKELAERAIRFMPVALEEGVLAGGGAAYLHCRPALDTLAGSGDELRAGAGLVRQALAAPMAWLLRNAGLHPAPLIADAARRGANYGYDVIGGQPVDMWQVGIVDAAKVCRLALETAVSVATMALTTDAIVLRRKPAVAVRP
jgi:chaperonin GroEL